STDTDPRARSSWCINDPVIRLREWAGERAYGLPDPPVASKIGSASRCEVKLHDKSGLLSREHAQLTPYMGGWKIREMNLAETPARFATASWVRLAASRYRRTRIATSRWLPDGRFGFFTVR